MTAKSMDLPPAYPGAVGIVQPAYTAPATAQVVQTTTAVPVAGEYNQTRNQRTGDSFKVVLVLMFVCLVFGLTMLIANAYSTGKGVKTYDHYTKRDSYYGYSSWTQRKGRRDWHQGIWSGVLHIVLALFYFALYFQVKKVNFNLDNGYLRGLGYFFCFCASILCVVAFAAMVMSGKTADFLSSMSDPYRGCYTGYNGDEPYCWCQTKSDYVTNAICSDAASVYYGLFTTIAVLNGISVIAFLVTAVLVCRGSCPVSSVCCGGYYYNTPVMVVTHGQQVVQAIPQATVVNVDQY